MINDVIIIGGGAAGLCAAVYLKQNSPKLSVRLLESQPRVGKKLALTGNGRCNITNLNIEPTSYHGNNVGFCEFALTKYDRLFTEDFFESIGVPFVFEYDKAYPASLQAASVVDCLRFAAEKYGVITHLETKVTSIQLSNGNYKVIADKMSFIAKNIIIATGLFSGGERLGCDGSMLNILKKADYKTVPTTPAIVQVKTETDLVKQLKGIKVDGVATLKIDGKPIRSVMDEILFCDYGLSGPAVMQISRAVSRTTLPCKISLDLMPTTDFDFLFDIIQKRAKQLSERTLDEFFTGMLNKRLGQIILKSAGCKLNDTASSLDKNLCRKITAIIKDFSFKVTGTTGFSNSQVTAGGLDTTQFDSKTMMSKFNKNLYAVGEILDIDGDCGGFNLQWAWSSAFCAVDNIRSNYDTSK